MAHYTLVGPAETLLRKQEPDTYFNTVSMLLPMIYKKLNAEFMGSDVVKYPFDELPSKLVEEFIIEKFREYGWQAKFSLEDGGIVLEIRHPGAA